MTKESYSTKYPHAVEPAKQRALDRLSEHARAGDQLACDMVC